MSSSNSVDQYRQWNLSGSGLQQDFCWNIVKSYHTVEFWYLSYSIFEILLRYWRKLKPLFTRLYLKSLDILNSRSFQGWEQELTVHLNTVKSFKFIGVNFFKFCGDVILWIYMNLFRNKNECYFVIHLRFSFMNMGTHKNPQKLSLIDRF